VAIAQCHEYAGELDALAMLIGNERRSNKQAIDQTNKKRASQRDLIISDDRVVLGSRMKASVQSGFLPSPYRL
jgi:predicted phosphoribosyltransferase